MNRSLVRIVTAIGAIAVAAFDLQAQDDGPKAGTWAVEGGSASGASLLKFRTPSSAWVLSAYGFFTRQQSQEFDPVSGDIVEVTENIVSAQLRVGLRGYSQARDRVRSFTTFSGIIGRSDFGSSTGGWLLGGAGEMGAAYFFSNRVSMGGSGELTAMYQGRSDDSPIGSGLSINFTGVRLLGTIYF
jgi:hypothetical protein